MLHVVVVDCVAIVPSVKTLVPAQLSIMTQRGEPRTVLPATGCSMCPLRCVRIHASSFSGVARRKHMGVDCSTRDRAASCGVIVLLVGCPASAAVEAATGRPSATARSFCRLLQSDLKTLGFCLWMVVAFRLEVAVALLCPFLSPSSGPFQCNWARFPVALVLAVS